MRNTPSRKSIASDLNNLYVSSNTGHIFGEIVRSLNVRLSTKSYMLLKRSKPLVSSDDHSVGESAITEELMFKRK